MNTYIKRMNQSINHKTRILNFINGNSVLDFGCGSGLLASTIKEQNPNISVVGYDRCKEMIKECSTFGHPDVFFTTSFPNKKYDTIILSAVLHEVYSDNGEQKDVYNLLEKLYSLLNIGGVIIIREARAEEVEKEEKILLKQKYDSMMFFMTYKQEYAFQSNISFIKEKNENGFNYYIQGQTNEIREFLNKYTWGWNSLKRESKEKLYFMTGEEFNQIGIKLGMKTTIQSYRQEDYFQYLEKKVEIIKKWDTHNLIIMQK